LRKLNSRIKAILTVLAVPDLFIVAYDVHLERPPRDINNGSEVNVSLIEILIIKSLLVLLLDDQVIEVNIAVDTARGEACIVLKPINAAHLVHMTLALIVLWTILRIKIIHPDRIVTHSTGK
jgi:hypothetical protein